MVRRAQLSPGTGRTRHGVASALAACCPEESSRRQHPVGQRGIRCRHHAPELGPRGGHIDAGERRRHRVDEDRDHGAAAGAMIFVGRDVTGDALPGESALVKLASALPRPARSASTSGAASDDAFQISNLVPNTAAISSPSASIPFRRSPSTEFPARCDSISRSCS